MVILVVGVVAYVAGVFTALVLLDGDVRDCDGCRREQGFEED